MAVRSTDKGATWTHTPDFVGTSVASGVLTPTIRAPVPTADILFEVVADTATRPVRGGFAYVVWQDQRFSGVG